MSTDPSAIMPSSYPLHDGRVKYDQFFIFGDSITQFSYDQRLGFGFGAALESGGFLRTTRCIVGVL